MAIRKGSELTVRLLWLLGAADSDVRYAAFLEAEALSDDNLLMLVDRWFSSLPVKQSRAGRMAAYTWFALNTPTA